MSWSNYISATSTLANAAPWFTAFFDEFRIYIYIGVGVIGAFIMIRFLVRIFSDSTGRLFGKRDSDFEYTRSIFKKYNLTGMGIKYNDGKSGKWRDI